MIAHAPTVYASDTSLALLITPLGTLHRQR